MERRVKERLVGAAVLVAAAIILIPEMLSGPRRDTAAPTTARNTTDAGVKTYTIDLSRSPGVQSGATIDEAAPPPEEISAPEPEKPSAATSTPTTEAPASEHQATPESTSPAPTASPTPRVAEAPTQAAPTTRTPPAASVTPSPPIASAAPVPTSRGWAVQLGSFASRATADRMVSEMSSQGQQAFVMPVKSGASTLYRVRIGPFADRARANEVLRDVKSRVANAAVVAHP